MPTAANPIHAVIGVRRDGPLTWYVRRSQHMSNYKEVWSLPSAKFDPASFRDVQDLDAAQTLFDGLSAQRFGGVPLRVLSHLTSGTSDANPMGVAVTLHLYEMAVPEEPLLQPRYYTDAAWLDAAAYEERSRGLPRGLCTRLWADYRWLRGYSDRASIPTPAV